MSEFVCSNTFCTFAPTLRTINRGGGGGEGRGAKVYIFGKVSSLVSPDILLAKPYELPEKSYCGKSLKFHATYQPQLKMLLLLLTSLEGITLNLRSGNIKAKKQKLLINFCFLL